MKTPVFAANPLHQQKKASHLTFKQQDINLEHSDLRTVLPVVMTVKWRCARYGWELWTETLDKWGHLGEIEEKHVV